MLDGEKQIQKKDSDGQKRDSPGMKDQSFNRSRGDPVLVVALFYGGCVFLPRFYTEEDPEL